MTGRRTASYRRGARSRPPAVAVIAVLLATACGSTVRSAAAPQDASTSHGLVLSPVSDPPSGGGELESYPDGSSDRSQAPARTGPAADPSSTSPRAPLVATGPAAGHDGPRAGACDVEVAEGTEGITGTTMSIGAPRIRNPAAHIAEAEPPEAEIDEYVAAMVDQLNATGGIACRQLETVWHDVDVSSTTSSTPALEQAQCATWTQDRPVFAAFPFTEAGEVIYPCLDRAGVAVLNVNGVSHSDAEKLRATPHVFEVNAAELTRSTATQVDALVRQGFLTQESRTGVVHYDDHASTRAVDQGLVPMLDRHGLHLTERRAVAIPESESALAEREQQLANAALRFKVSQVDRVVFVRGDGMAASFMTAAEANAYRPRYGLTTAELPATLSGAPRAQFVGAQGIGWLPLLDLQPRWPDPWPEQTQCRTFYEERGFDLSRMIDRMYAFAVCEGFAFLSSAVDAAPRPLSASAFVRGGETLGDRYVSPTVGPTRFGPGQHDGASVYRDVVYREACGCFEYVGPARPLAR